jgi:brefeldin A-inhibited guanine nucleotide-exchange protein
MSTTGEVEGTLEEVSLSEENDNVPNGSQSPRLNGHRTSYSANPSQTAPVIPSTSPHPLEIHATKAAQIPSTVPTSPPRVTNSSSTSITSGQGQMLSSVLITSALKTIAASKEAKRSQQLREAVEHALEMVNQGQGGDKPREIFEPLRLACETQNEKLMVPSLDCISKLISYAFFVENSDVAPQNYTSPPGSPTASAAGLPVSLADLVTHTITSCYTESTSDAVSLQIVKALLQIVLSPQILVHHSSLLKAVRTVYNIFLLSQSPMTQNVAQGGLTQMVHHIFTRIQTVPQAQLAVDQPISAAQSTFSLSTPTTADIQSKGYLSRPQSMVEDENLDDDVKQAMATPLPIQEGEEGEDGSR